MKDRTFSPYSAAIPRVLVRGGGGWFEEEAPTARRRRAFQEGALTAMASVADCAKSHFIKYYDSVMPLLRHILVNANDASHHLLRAKVRASACICLSVCLDADGRSCSCRCVFKGPLWPWHPRARGPRDHLSRAGIGVHLAGGHGRGARAFPDRRARRHELHAAIAGGSCTHVDRQTPSWRHGVVGMQANIRLRERGRASRACRDCVLRGRAAGRQSTPVAHSAAFQMVWPWCRAVGP
jgi:hypothetical protein